MKRIAAVLASSVLAACGSSSAPVSPPTSRADATPSLTAPVTSSPSVTTVTPTTAVPADAGRWALVAPGPTNISAPAAWTGHELLVSRGGCCGELGSVNLSAFDPVSGVWRQLPVTPLTPRSGAVGVWTGTEMIIAGGEANPTGVADEQAASAVDGAAWNPVRGLWRHIAMMPVPLPEPGSVKAFWTGTEMLVWASRAGGIDGLGQKMPGREVVLAYNPAMDRWRQLPLSGLTPRDDPAVVWTGRELVVWAGLGFQRASAYSDGARLDPATDRWRPLPAAPVPGRGSTAAVWTGREVLLWGGADGSAPASQVGQGAAYSPETDRWRVLPRSPLRAKSMPSGVWTGRFFIVLGGAAGPTLPVPGPGAAAYDPSTDSWTALPVAPDFPASATGPSGSASQRVDALAVWTGSAALFVGGMDFRAQGNRSDGLMWIPAG